MAEIKKVLEATSDLPRTKSPGDFDRRAWLSWRWVVSNIDYRANEPATDPYDPTTQLAEFYQFPAETIALRKGDCDDSAFLLASLLVASGISEYCVRVVMGPGEVEHEKPK